MTTKPGPLARAWRITAWLLLLGVGLYYAFGVLDTLGLAKHIALAKVEDKQYYAPGTSYQTMNIGGKTFIRPYQTAEAWALKLRLGGQEAVGLVDQATYRAINPGDEVQATYERGRLTGNLHIVAVAQAPEKGGN